MKYKYREYVESTILPDGDYPFNVIYTKETEDYNLVMIKISSSVGYNKISVFLRDSEQEYDIKIRKHLCETIGKPQLFNQEEISSKDFIGGKGIVRIFTRINKKTGQQENAILDFIVKDSKESSEQKSFDDQTIPF